MTRTPAEAVASDRLKVMILGHEADTTNVLRHAAEALGADVLEIESVCAAAEALASFHADVLVADGFLETDGGLDVVTWLRQRNHRPMPVAIVVAYPGAAMNSRRALAAGFHAFLLKPVSLHAARTAIGLAAKVSLKRSRAREKR